MKLRLRIAILTANEPFLFYTGVGKDYYTGTMAWSLKGFIKALKEVDAKAIEFHIGNGDFESWAQSSLKDKKLASKIQRPSMLQRKKARNLEKQWLTPAKKRYIAQSKQLQDATQLF